jgi:hypothetical protein
MNSYKVFLIEFIAKIYTAQLLLDMFLEKIVEDDIDGDRKVLQV